MESIKNMKNIPINIVADVLGVAPIFVRLGLQEERLPFGTAVKTSSQWTYHVSYELLKKYVGEERIDTYEKNFIKD